MSARLSRRATAPVTSIERETSRNSAMLLAGMRTTSPEAIATAAMPSRMPRAGAPRPRAANPKRIAAAAHTIRINQMGNAATCARSASARHAQSHWS